ncbi:MAG: NADH-quinone oxidoreductase subunit NuoN [Pseudomonadota bacterium]
MTSLAELTPILPELIVAVGAMALLMLGVFLPETDEQAERIGWLAIGVLVTAGFVLVQNGWAPSRVFDGAFVTDGFAVFMKLLVLGGAGVALILAFDEFRRLGIMRFEYPVLILLSTVGMMVMVSAGDLIALYIGLELQSLALYVVAAYRRDSIKASEAGLKYFVLGALSSGMLLYGASLIYGFTGSVNFQVIANAAKGPEAASNLWLIFGLVFLLVGLAFKISAVPFHMWTPDVYEGSATSVTAFFSAAPKVAAMALLVRVMLDAFPGIGLQWQQIIAFLAVASMLLGAFAAIGQTDIKRMLAYSSIANIGFALIGLAANSEQGTQGVLIYMAIYLVMTLGAFACVLAMRRDDSAVTEISELAGLAQTNLPVAVALMVLMFSMAGIPPLAGFWGKYYVFLAAIEGAQQQPALYILAVVGVLASVVGVVYYLNIVGKMFFAEPAEAFAPVPAKTYAVIMASTIITIAGFLALGPFVDVAAAAAKAFQY